MGLRWPSMVDAGPFCLKSRSAKSGGFWLIHAHWRLMHGSKLLLTPPNNVRKRLRRVSTGFDSRCTQYLQNPVKFSSKKVITGPSSRWEQTCVSAASSSLCHPHASPFSLVCIHVHSLRTSATPAYSSSQYSMCGRPHYCVRREQPIIL